MKSQTRLLFASSAVGIAILTLWHRATVRKERQRAVSEAERSRNLNSRAA